MLQFQAIIHDQSQYHEAKIETLQIYSECTTLQGNIDEYVSMKTKSYTFPKLQYFENKYTSSIVIMGSLYSLYL